MEKLKMRKRVIKNLGEIVKFKCPQCKKYGWMSTYPTTNGKIQCTNCANKMRNAY